MQENSLLSHSENWLSSSVWGTSFVPGDNVPQQTLVAERPLPTRLSSGLYATKNVYHCIVPTYKRPNLDGLLAHVMWATLFNLPPELTGYPERAAHWSPIASNRV